MRIFYGFLSLAVLLASQMAAIAQAQAKIELVNADTHETLAFLGNGGVYPLKVIPHEPVAIAVRAHPDTPVDEIFFSVAAPGISLTHAEQGGTYTFPADVGTPGARSFVPEINRTYTITATGRRRGAGGQMEIVTRSQVLLEVKSDPAVQQEYSSVRLQSLTVLDWNSQFVLGTAAHSRMTPLQVNPAQRSPIAIRAELASGGIESFEGVDFYVNGTLLASERSLPFMAPADFGSPTTPWIPEVGEHVIVAMPIGMTQDGRARFGLPLRTTIVITAPNVQPTPVATYTPRAATPTPKVKVTVKPVTPKKCGKRRQANRSTRVQTRAAGGKVCKTPKPKATPTPKPRRPKKTPAPKPGVKKTPVAPSAPRKTPTPKPGKVTPVPTPYNGPSRPVPGATPVWRSSFEVPFKFSGMSSGNEWTGYNHGYSPTFDRRSNRSSIWGVCDSDMLERRLGLGHIPIPDRSHVYCAEIYNTGRDNKGMGRPCQNGVDCSHRPYPLLQMETKTPYVNRFWAYVADVDLKSFKASDWVHFGTWGGALGRDGTGVWEVMTLTFRGPRAIMELSGSAPPRRREAVGGSTSFPLNKWVRFTVYIDYTSTPTHTIVWMDGKKILQGWDLERPWAKRDKVTHVHWGLYANKEHKKGVQLNDDIQVWTLSGPLADQTNEPPSPFSE